MKRIALFLVLASSAFLQAQDTPVVLVPPDVEIARSVAEDTGPLKEYTVQVGRFVAFYSKVTAASLTYDEDNPDKVDMLKIPVGQAHSGVMWDDPTGRPKSHRFTGAKSSIGIFTAAVEGKVRIKVWQNEKGPDKGPGKIAEFVMNVVATVPVTPTPVIPTPVVPTPVVPVPTIISKDQFRVLFVYEKDVNLTAKQLGIKNSTKLRAYLKEKTVGGEGFKFWDQNMDVSNSTQVWKDIWTATKPTVPLDKLPAVVIFNGPQGEYHPWEEDEDKMIELLKKYGG